MKKLLSALLAGLMMISSTEFVNAEDAESFSSDEKILESLELDPESLHVEKLGDQVAKDSEIEEDVLPYRLDDTVRVSIVLDDDSALDAGYSAENYALNQATVDYRAELRKKQDAVTAEIEAMLQKPLNVKWNLTLAVNIISAEITYGDIEKIKQIAGVKDVFVENRYEAQVDEINTSNTSSGMVGASAAWTEGYTGAGTRIAIIDTGIDQDHQSFNGDAFSYSISKLGKTVDLVEDGEINTSQLNGKGKYFSSKIPFGYNYVDTNTTINHLSDTQGEHGSHVAGIAAANKYIKNGNSYDLAADTVKAVGMAPDAQLFVMKVFGSGGGAYDSDYMAAIEDAIALDCDSVNLSLGSGAPGFTYAGEYQDVMNRLVSEGYNLVSTISAGNSGAFTDELSTDLYIDNVSMHTGGSPGTFINSLGVASADNIGATGKPLVFPNNKEVYYTESSETGGGMSSIAGTFSYVYIDSIGEAADYKTVNSAVSLSGKIVIVNRGELSFVEKGENAKSYSPKALIVANNAAGTISMDLTDFTGSFPMVSITLADAETIKENSTKNTTGTYTYYTGSVTVTSTTQSGSVTTRENAEVSSFSSWGVPGSLMMKPEITAPGGNIYSVFGTNKTSSGTAGGTAKYELMSGTSMAAPHMAGLAAVLSQYLKENNKELDGYTLRALNQSLLMSTATPMKNDGQYVSILQQGAGLADVSRAIKANSVIMMDQNDGTLTAETGSAKDGKVKAEFGDNPGRNKPYTYAFSIYNMNDQDVEYSLDTRLFTQARYTEDGEVFMDYGTTSDLIGNWDVSYTWADVEGETSYDANLDGGTDRKDVQAILDYVTYTAAGAAYDEAFNADAADVDGSGSVTTADAYALIEWLSSDEGLADGIVPKGGSRKVTVTITPDHSLDSYYPAGAYVEGFTYVNAVTKTDDGSYVDPVEHTIPLLGFYGSWTDASMFDNTSYTDTLYGTAKTPYSGKSDTNNMTVEYNGSLKKFTGNPYMTEEVFPAERLAVNSNSKLGSVSYNLIRSAGTTGTAISKTDGINGKITDVLSSSVTGNEVTGLWYYENQGTWQNTGTKSVSLNKTPASLGLKEGDTFRAGFYAVPEYNGMLVSSDMTSASAGQLSSGTFVSVLKSNVLGRGALVGYDFTIDDTAPIIGDAVLSGNTLTVSASDNLNLAYVAVLSLDGKTKYAEKAPGKPEYTVTFDVSDAITNAAGYVAVFAGDYAGNEAAKAVKVNDRTSEDKSLYVLTNELTAGNEYLIVSRNTAGSGYALGRNNTSAAADAVTVNAGTSATGNAIYIDGDNVDSTSVWTAGSGYTFKNGEYYLRRSSSSIAISTSTSSSSWTWNASANRLYQTSGKTSYYLRYANNAFSLSTSTASIYLYKKQTVLGTVDPYSVNGVSLTRSSLDLYKGNEADLIAEVQPLTASDRSVAWTSSNPSVASVDSSGHVTALAAGSATITASSNADSAYNASCTVNVTSINKALNGILWDEDGGVYFSGFNASSLPAYSKLHTNAQEKELASAFMNDSSTLYAGTLDTSAQETVLYTINRSSYEASEFGTNYVMAMDTARASTRYTGYFVYAFAKYLIFGNLEPEEDEDGTFSGLPYGLLDVSETIGDAYVAGVAARSIGSTSSSYYFLDENGIIWQTSLTISSSSISFSTPTKVIETGISTSFLYQSLYYDGTYLYWTHYDNNVTELIIINPSTKAIYHAGDFGEGVWPVGGIYVNGSAAPASESEADDISEPVMFTKLADRSELMSTEIMNRISAESGKAAAGSVNSIQNYKPVSRESKSADALNVPVMKEVSASDTANSGTEIVISENEETHYGLYKIAYDPAVLSFVSNQSAAEFSSYYADTVNGFVYIAYADEAGFTENQEIDTVTFSEPSETTSVTLTTVETSMEQPGGPVEIPIEAAEEYIVGINAALELRGSTNLLFYLEVPESQMNSTIHMTLGNRTKDVKASDGALTEDGTRMYKFPVYSTQMKENVVLTVTGEDGQPKKIIGKGSGNYLDSLSYSVQRAIDYYKKNYTDGLEKVARAMEDYGTCAQIQFTDNVEGLSASDEVKAVTKEDLSAYEPKGEASVPGMKLKTMQLELMEDIGIIFRYSHTAGELSDYKFTIDGKEAKVLKAGENEYAVKLSKLAANKLDEAHEFRVEDSNGNSQTITFSALSYAQMAVSGSYGENIENLSKALYLYSEAANAYFGD